MIYVLSQMRTGDRPKYLWLLFRKNNPRHDCGAYGDTHQRTNTCSHAVCRRRVGRTLQRGHWRGHRHGPACHRPKFASRSEPSISQASVCPFIRVRDGCLRRPSRRGTHPVTVAQTQTRNHLRRSPAKLRTLHPCTSHATAPKPGPRPTRSPLQIAGQILPLRPQLQGRRTKSKNKTPPLAGSYLKT